MHDSQPSRTSPSKFVVAALLAVSAAFVLPTPPTASAADPVRQTATSPATGATYAAAWSCVGGQVRFAIVKPGVYIEARFRFETDGQPPDAWLTRSIPEWQEATLLDTGGELRNDNGRADRVVLEDRVKGTTEYTHVMTFSIPDCPDYSVGTRSVFTGIDPERVLDTRAATAVNYSGGKPGPGAVVKIPAGAFPGKPAGATAVSLVLTGTEASGPGFLQAFPTGGATTGSSSNVNLPVAGTTVANLAVVPFGSDGSISIFTSGGSHVIADVNGYFVAEPDPVAAGRLVTIDQTRLLDTRPSSAVEYTGAKPSGSTLTVDLTRQSSGLPPGATAAVVNITATESAGPGFVQSAAGGALVPGTSSVLNLTGAGQTVAGLSIVPLDANGRIDLFTSTSAHLIVDLVGWFTGSSATAGNAGKFVPLPPERIYDSRFDSMVNYAFDFYSPDGVSREDTIYAAGMDQIAGAVFINGTVTGNAGPGFVMFGQRVGDLTSNINMSGPNSTVANAAIVRARGGQYPAYDIYVSTRTHVIADIAGYFTR